MEAGRLQLVPGAWIGWHDLAPLPAPEAPWDATPAFVTSVEPLGTGKGLLRVEAILALRLPRPVRVEAVLKVRLHRADHLVATWLDEGRERTVCLSEASDGWIERHCPDLPARRPPQYEVLVGMPDVQAYLAQTFGKDAGRILAGASRSDWQLKAMPEARGVLQVDRRLRGVEAYWLRRGLIPAVMEQKWFVFAEGAQVHFHRSWTGLCIFSVDLSEEGEDLRLGPGVFNADPEQYKAGSAEEAAAMFGYVLDRAVLGRATPWPGPTDDGAGGALAAWGAVGSDSL